MESSRSSGNDRHFGLVMGAAAAALAWFITPSTSQPSFLSLSLLVLAGVSLSLAIMAPHRLHQANVAWMRLGEQLGRVVNPIVLGLLFLVVFVPIGALLRIAGHDPLRLKRDPSRKTYWINRPDGEPEPATIVRQF